MLETCTHPAFKGLTDKKFKIYSGSNEPSETELIEVSELVETNRQEIFSVFFSIPEGVRPMQNSYRMENTELGELFLLLVPVGYGDGHAFEAVFNRIKK